MDSRPEDKRFCAEWLQSAPNFFFLNRILVCYGFSQIFELFHPYEGTNIRIYIETSIVYEKSHKIKGDAVWYVLGEETSLQSSVRKGEGKRPLRSHRCSLEDNIEINLTCDERTCIWFIRFRMGFRGWPLWKQYWTIGLHKIWEISWVCVELTACENRLCYMESFSLNM